MTFLRINITNTQKRFVLRVDITSLKIILKDLKCRFDREENNFMGRKTLCFHKAVRL